MAKNKEEIIIPKPTKERLNRAVKAALEWEGTMDGLKKQLAEAEEQYKKIVDDLLPGLLDEIGADEVKLDNGTKIKKVERFTVTANGKNEVKAASIFKRLKAGDLAKYKMEFTFTPSPDNRHYIEEIKKWQVKSKVPMETWTETNAGTLKSWVKEQLKNGKLQPKELDDLGLFQYNTTEIKPAKEEDGAKGKGKN